jgi:predicted acyl esterase
MLIWLSIPPHQKYQGGIDQNNDLLNIWKERLNNLIPLDSYWIKHQNRDQYWRHGSICEDYSKILCPVLLIGGFADLYTDPVFRLINQLKCPKRAIIGPWGHQWPLVFLFLFFLIN